MVAEGDEGGQTAAQQGAIGLQGRGAVGDRHGGALLDLHEGLGLRDKEAAFGEVGAPAVAAQVGERPGAPARWGVRRVHPWGRRWIAAASWAARSPVALRV